MIVELVKPRLFLSKVPMVYGTVISNAIVFGAIVFGAAMLVQFRPELEQHRHRHRPGRRTPASWTRRAPAPFPTIGAVHRGPRGVKRVVPLE
jgi:hypothetical protein